MLVILTNVTLWIMFMYGSALQRATLPKSQRMLHINSEPNSTWCHHTKTEMSSMTHCEILKLVNCKFSCFCFLPVMTHHIRSVL